MNLGGPGLHQLAVTASEHAAESLASLVYKEILVKGPAIYAIKSTDRLVLRLRTPHQILSITQNVYGEESARISIAFNIDDASTLAGLLTARPGSATQSLGPLELDALKETANITGNAYLAGLARALRLEEAPAAPVVIEGSLEELVQSLVPHPESLCIESRLLAQEDRLEVIMLIAVKTSLRLHEELKRISSRAKIPPLQSARP